MFPIHPDTYVGWSFTPKRLLSIWQYDSLNLIRENQKQQGIYYKLLTSDLFIQCLLIVETDLFLSENLKRVTHHMHSFLPLSFLFPQNLIKLLSQLSAYSKIISPTSSYSLDDFVRTSCSLIFNKEQHLFYIAQHLNISKKSFSFIPHVYFSRLCVTFFPSFTTFK